MEPLVYLASAIASTPALAPTVETVQGSSDLAKTLLTAGAGVGATIFAGLVAAWIARRSEHSKWLRDERLKAYVNMSTLINTAVRASVTARMAIASETPATYFFDTKDIPSVYASIRLLGPTKLSDLAHELAILVTEGATNMDLAYGVRVDAAEAAYLAEAQKVLHIRMR